MTLVAKLYLACLCTTAPWGRVIHIHTVVAQGTGAGTGTGTRVPTLEPSLSSTFALSSVLASPQPTAATSMSTSISNSNTFLPTMQPSTTSSSSSSAEQSQEASSPVFIIITPTEFTATNTPTESAAESTTAATAIATASPSEGISWNPSSKHPTIVPTISPVPTVRPSLVPSISEHPSDMPSTVPSVSRIPSRSPSLAPSLSIFPSYRPSESFKPSLSVVPSYAPSKIPSDAPSLSSKPSNGPSISSAPSLSSGPSDLPSDVPSDLPTNVPTISLRPSQSPSMRPTGIPSATPSDVPSVLPSSAPSHTPIYATRSVKMYINGLVNEFQKGSAKSEEFQHLIDDQTQWYWTTVSRGGTVVYNSTTEFDFFLPVTAADWVPPPWLPTTTIPPAGMQDASASPQQPRTAAAARQFENALNASGAFNETMMVMPTDNNYNITAPPLIFGNDTFPFLNGTGGLFSNMTNNTNQTMIEEGGPTSTPTTTTEPSLPPSYLPTAAPSISSFPSTAPTATPPSAAPSVLPNPRTRIISYTQNIIYGEKFGANDTRVNSVTEILKYPFLFDQLRFTEALINITDNQLALFIVGIEVQDLSTEAPSMHPSDMPSQVPSLAPSVAPVQTQVPAPNNSISTGTLVAAVVVPVLVVLFIAFAGIIYLTRVDNDNLSPADEVTPLPPAQQQQEPGTPSGGRSVSEGGDQQSLAQQQQSLAPPFLLGTPSADSLLDPSDGALQTTTTQPQTHSQPTHHSQHSHHSQDAHSSQTSKHPIVVMAPPPRTPSHGSNVSEITSGEVMDRFRRVPQGTPGYMSGTGTFTPSLAPLPFGTGTHSREPSFQGSDNSQVSRAGISRAATTGAIPSGPSSAAGRISPFHGVRGAIPTIPTVQLSTTTEVTSVGGEDLHNIQTAESESESDSEDLPSMTAFNLQIEDLDDFVD